MCLNLVELFCCIWVSSHYRDYNIMAARLKRNINRCRIVCSILRQSSKTEVN